MEMLMVMEVMAMIQVVMLVVAMTIMVVIVMVILVQEMEVVSEVGYGGSDGRQCYDRGAMRRCHWLRWRWSCWWRW